MKVSNDILVTCILKYISFKIVILFYNEFIMFFKVIPFFDNEFIKQLA